MSNKYLYFLFWFLMLSTSGYTQEKEKTKKPNIVFILTDDLGFGDIGVLFQKFRVDQNNGSVPAILTPNLDALAKNGALLTQYAAAPVCAPSRASLLLGVSQGHANVRDNQFDKALEDNYTLGSVLQTAGYTTMAIGKWGLQGKEKAPDWPAHPLKRGFNEFYGYIAHSDGHEHYPKEGLVRGEKDVWHNYSEISEALDKCYTGDLFTAKAKDFIIDTHHKDKDQPFFLYLAYDTPHAALQLPTQAYPEGKGEKGGLQWLGNKGKMINTASGQPDSWIHPDFKNATYDHDGNSDSPPIIWPEIYKRYATIIRRIDDQVGDIVQLLGDLDIDKNTLLVFTSDNGPSKESYLSGNNKNYLPSFFQSYGPFDGIKRDVLEGGVRMPTIAFWPGTISAGTIVEEPSISYDWLPTFTEIAGLPAPVRTDGFSLYPFLTGANDGKSSRPIYIEYFNGGKTPAYEDFADINKNKKRGQMQMIRLENYIGLRYNIKTGDEDFKIYDITLDPHQKNDLAGKFGELQKQMKTQVLQLRMPNPTAPRPYDNIAIPASSPAKVQNGLKWKSFNFSAPWLAKTEHLDFSEHGTTRSINAFLKKHSEKDKLYLIEGFVNIPVEGYYTISLKTDGKAFLRVHDAAVIDADYNYIPGELKTGKVLLSKGYHPFKIYYTRFSKKMPFLEIKLKDEKSKSQELSFVD